MTKEQSEILRDAIARNLGAVLSLPSAGMLRHCKSRFLGEHGQGFLLESAAGEAPLLQALIAEAKPCGVAFKSGVHKVVFAAPVLRLLPQHRVNADNTLDVLQLAFPTEIKSIQRRANYRVKVPEDSGFLVRVWRISPRSHLKDTPMAAQEIATQLRDLSLGGMGVRFTGEEGQPPKVATEDRLRVQFTAGAHSFLLEGRMRKPTAVSDGATVITGVTFNRIEQDLQGRQTLAQLTRIIGELQREELRRYRMGLMKAG